MANPDQSNQPFDFGSFHKNIEQYGFVPDVATVQSADVGEKTRRSGPLIGPRMARVACVMLLATGVGLAYYRWGYDAVQSAQSPNPAVAPANPTPEAGGDPLGVPQVEYCQSPTLITYRKGNSKVTSDNPDDWKTGVMMRIKIPKDEQGYFGTSFGYTGPEGSADDATMSPPQNRDMLANPQLMRDGHDPWKLVIFNIAEVGSPVCAQEPQVALTETSVDAALKQGAQEPI